MFQKDFYKSKYELKRAVYKIRLVRFPRTTADTYMLFFYYYFISKQFTIRTQYITIVTMSKFDVFIHRDRITRIIINYYY